MKSRELSDVDSDGKSLTTVIKWKLFHITEVFASGRLCVKKEERRAIRKRKDLKGVYDKE